MARDINSKGIPSKRNIWSERETSLLIQLIQEEGIMKQLDGNRRRNSDIYSRLVGPMSEAGFSRDVVQIRTKWKHLQQEFKREVDARMKSGAGGVGLSGTPYFDTLYEILGDRVNSVFPEEGVDYDPAYAKELAVWQRAESRETSPAVDITEASAVWDREAVFTMLFELKEKMNESKKGKDLYQEVTSALAGLGYQFSVQQVRSKVDALKRRYKSIKDNMMKSGYETPSPWEFFEVLDEIFGTHIWVTPRATTYSTEGPSTSFVASEVQVNEPIKKRRRLEEFLEGLYEKVKKDREEIMNRQREEARKREEERERRKQKRHEEKMALRRQFLELLSRVASSREENKK